MNNAQCEVCKEPVSYYRAQNLLSLTILLDEDSRTTGVLKDDQLRCARCWRNRKVAS